jgi:hypothetical protein
LRRHLAGFYSAVDTRAMFEEILGKKNDIGRDLVALVEIYTEEHAANQEYEQQTPLLYAFWKGLSIFEGLAHWVAGLPAPYVRAPSGPGPLYQKLGMDGRPVGQGRPKGSTAQSSGYENLEFFVEQLTYIVAQSGGRLTFSDHHTTGTLVAALELLRNHLPPDCRAMPSKATMRRIKERSTAHLYRSTPEDLYGGAPVAGPEHHQAVVELLRAEGFDPATIDQADIARAAEICAREGAPPDAAFLIAFVHSLIDSGYIDRKTAKKVLGDSVRSRRPTKAHKSTMRRIKGRSSK